jgi:hypothetical protein
VHLEKNARLSPARVRRFSARKIARLHPPVYPKVYWLPDRNHATVNLLVNANPDCFFPDSAGFLSCGLTGLKLFLSHRCFGYCVSPVGVGQSPML